MEIYKKLFEIQQALEAPKGQYNSFGKYKYRSCEDILGAAKPLLRDQKLLIIMTDEAKEICGRHYIEATATAIDAETGECVSVKAYAREEEAKKGMDGSQVTGASSSYARKYALNGLLCIDDTKDSDATNDGGKGGNSSEGTSNSKSTSRNDKKAQDAPDGKLYCEACGGVINGLRTGGNEYSAQDVASRALKKHNAQLCWNCQKEREKAS